MLVARLPRDCRPDVATLTMESAYIILTRLIHERFRKKSLCIEERQKQTTKSSWAIFIAWIGNYFSWLNRSHVDPPHNSRAFSGKTVGIAPLKRCLQGSWANRPPLTATRETIAIVRRLKCPCSLLWPQHPRMFWYISTLNISRLFAELCDNDTCVGLSDCICIWPFCVVFVGSFVFMLLQLVLMLFVPHCYSWS